MRNFSHALVCIMCSCFPRAARESLQIWKQTRWSNDKAIIDFLVSCRSIICRSRRLRKASAQSPPIIVNICANMFKTNILDSFPFNKTRLYHWRNQLRICVDQLRCLLRQILWKLLFKSTAALNTVSKLRRTSSNFAVASRNFACCCYSCVVSQQLPSLFLTETQKVQNLKYCTVPWVSKIWEILRPQIL